jgi:hydroxyacylglutathione hydrolase
MIKVEPIPAFRDNYIWFIIHEPNRKVAIVDPGDAAPVLDHVKANNLDPVAVLITHHHPDHVGGIGGILEQYRIPVYGPAHEQIPGRSHALKEGDVLDLEELGLRFEILDMPGHTSGAIAYYTDGMVFVGDTLFLSGCGRLFEGTPEQMHASLGKLAQLPDETKIYCAHEYTLANLDFALAVEPDNQDIQQQIRDCKALRSRNSPTVPGTIAREKRVNPFLRSAEAGVVQAASRHSGKALDNQVAVFAAIRKWKDTF